MNNQSKPFCCCTVDINELEDTLNTYATKGYKLVTVFNCGNFVTILWDSSKAL